MGNITVKKYRGSKGGVLNERNIMLTHIITFWEKKHPILRRAEAIKYMKNICCGRGIWGERFPDSMKGTMAQKLWYSDRFRYGMEYGILLVLQSHFNITKEDVIKCKMEEDEKVKYTV